MTDDEIVTVREEALRRERAFSPDFPVPITLTTTQIVALADEALARGAEIQAERSSSWELARDYDLSKDAFRRLKEAHDNAVEGCRQRDATLRILDKTARGLGADVETANVELAFLRERVAQLEMALRQLPETL